MAENKRKRAVSVKQHKAIVAMLECRTLEQAARRAGIGYATIRRWMADDPDFRAVLCAAEATAIDCAVTRLSQLTDKAVTAIESVLSDTTAPAGARVRAASVVFDWLVKMRELRTTEQRLLALEERVFAK